MKWKRAWSCRRRVEKLKSRFPLKCKAQPKSGKKSLIWEKKTILRIENLNLCDKTRHTYTTRCNYSTVHWPSLPSSQRTKLITQLIRMIGNLPRRRAALQSVGQLWHGILSSDGVSEKHKKGICKEFCDDVPNYETNLPLWIHHGRYHKTYYETNSPDQISFCLQLFASSVKFWSRKIFIMVLEMMFLCREHLLWRTSILWPAPSIFLLPGSCVSGAVICTRYNARSNIILLASWSVFKNDFDPWSYFNFLRPGRIYCRPLRYSGARKNARTLRWLCDCWKLQRRSLYEGQPCITSSVCRVRGWE